MKQARLIGVWIGVFCISFSGYLINQAHPYLDLQKPARQTWAWGSLLFLSFILFIFRKGSPYWIAGQFLLVAWILWFVTIGIFILNCYGLFTDPYYILGVIDLGTLIATYFILRAGGKYDLLND